MDDDVEISLIDDEEENSNPQTDQSSTDAGVNVMYEEDYEPASIEIAAEPWQDDPPEEKEPEEEEMAEITKTIKKPKAGTALDKFKRRLIRAIAHYINNDQTPTEEIWKELKKQTGCDCKLLWDRMRALTMKKLRRLFTTEDTISNITPIARLTVTDWLLFDLVLVHEKLDVIGEELLEPDVKESPKILQDLFATVVIFKLEELQGDELTKAWFEATRHYNGKYRQASPMLLQKRWYQMKARVREKFYQFWFSYRGDQRQLLAANEFKPTDLEMEIVKYYKYITTKQFETWEELIDKKKVALPGDFERLQLAKRRIFRTENGPDLEVIEPQVETIDLENDTDFGEHRDSSAIEQMSKENSNLVKVKIEKIDEISDDDDDVHILESVHIPLETSKNSEGQNYLGDANRISVKQDISAIDDNHSSISYKQLSNIEVINESCVTNAQNMDFSEPQNIDEKPQYDTEMLMPTIVASASIANITSDFDIVMPKISNVTSAAIISEEPAESAVNNEINDILESVAENISTKNLFNVLTSPLCTENATPATNKILNLDTSMKNNTTEKNKKNASNAQNTEFSEQENADSEEYQHEAEIVMPTIVTSTSIANISDDFHLVMPKILNVSSAAILTEEPADDAVNINTLPSPLRTDKIVPAPSELNSRNKETEIKVNTLPSPLRTDKIVPAPSELNSRNKETEIKVETDGEKKFKALPSNFNIFDGIELEDNGIEYVEEDDDMREVLPKEIKTVKTDDSDRGNTPTIDLKLLLTPVTYTKKLDDMDVFRFIDYNAVKDKRVIENAAIESKPLHRNSVKMEEICKEREPLPDIDVFCDSASEYYSEDDFGPETISSSSWLLKKLKKISHNPIQLCKNPDFNTRLKRLSAGFYSSERNRRLLKECKPLTIDLHKSFESKLHNNTLYLKTDSPHEMAVENTVLPAVMPTENLINNVMNDILYTAPPLDYSSGTQFSPDPVLLDCHPTKKKESINLPVTGISHLNENMLTVEVTPIQVSDAKPPVNIVSKQPDLQNSDIIDSDTVSTSGILSKFVRDKISSSSFSEVNLTSDPPSELIHSKSSNSNKSVGLDKKSEGGFHGNLLSNDNIVNTTNRMKSLESVNNSYEVLKGNILNRFKKQQQQQKNLKEPKKVRYNSVEVSWNPKPQKYSIPQDILLTSDTVDKILNVCKGDADVLMKNPKQQKKNNKMLRKKALKQKEKEESQGKDEVSEDFHDNHLSFVSEISPHENLTKDIEHNTIQNQMAQVTKISNNETIQETIVKSNKNKYCCWAQEKIAKLDSNKRPFKKHDCPRPMCNCCCRQELIDKMFQIKADSVKTSRLKKKQIGQRFKVTSAQSPYENSAVMPQSQFFTKIPQDTSTNFTQMSVKVSVGINTDFDMDFENGFAANLAEFNTSSNSSNQDIDSASSIKVTYAPNINQVNGQTQTSVNLLILDKNAKALSGKSYRSNVSPMILEEKNSTVSFEGCNEIQKKNAVIPNKNNSFFSHNNRYSSNVIPKKLATVSKNQILPYTNSNSQNLISKKKRLVSDEKNPTLKDHNLYSLNMIYNNNPKIAPKNSIFSKPLIVDKSSVVLREKGQKLDKVLFLTNDKTQTPCSRMPICVGKNEILLCSFEKPHLNQPKLNNISNNMIINSSPIIPPEVALPEGVRIILLPNKELALSIDPGVELDSKQLDYLPTLMASIQQQLAHAETVDKITNSHIDPLENKDDTKEHSNSTSINCEECVIKLDDNKPLGNANSNEAITLSCNEQLKDQSDDNMDLDVSKNKKAGCDNKKSDDCVIDNSNASVDDFKDNSEINKKTILSDLMEMSGISAEDTHITNNGSPSKQQLELHPMPVIEGLQLRNANAESNQHNETYINNPLGNNPLVQTALNRCPELSVVFSYQEIKYASENNAKFFKMDIKTGVVVPLNLLIRKHSIGKSNREVSKSVIDLTDDPDEDETINIEEQNTSEVNSPDHKETDRAVPVKLFSSVPTILRRGKSLLVQSVTSDKYPKLKLKKKNMIRVIQVKRKRKEPLNCVIPSIDLDSDTEQKEDKPVGASSEAKPEISKEDDSDSDDEPLASKAKRMKESFGRNEPTEPLNQTNDKDDRIDKFDENTQNIEMGTGDEIEVTEPVAKNPTVDDTLKNVTEEAAVNLKPHLEPVVFEPSNFGDNVPESSDEDCILGV